MLKDTQTASDRITLKLQYGANGASARPKSAPGKRTSAKDAEPEDDEVAEKNRMQFVELLLKTREIASGSTYEDAVGILKDSAEWKLLDDKTRRECFEIFVEYLDKPHKKKKDKDEKKSKKKGKDEEEAPAAEGSPEAGRKRKKDKERKESGSAERGRRGSKKEKRGDDKERERSKDRDRDRKRRAA